MNTCLMCSILNRCYRLILVAIPILVISSCNRDQNYTAVLIEAYDIVRVNALKSDNLDWTGIYEELMRQAPGIQDEASLFNTLQNMLDKLDDNHSFLRTADGRRWRPVTQELSVMPAYTPCEEPNIAYIEVCNTVSGNDEDMRAYADSLYTKIVTACKPGQIGWILDFRRNTGGNYGQCWRLSVR